MQDVELFVHMAEIAGVFVGFGALIAIRSGDASDVYDVTFIGMVVWIAVQVVADALAPIAVSRFDVPAHALWASCSVLFLVLFWVVDAVMRRIWPERRAFLAANPMRARARVEIVGGLFWVPMTIALGLILLGAFPDREQALYFAALVLLLLGDAMLLLATVTAAGRPAGGTSGSAGAGRPTDAG